MLWLILTLLKLNFVKSQSYYDDSEYNSDLYYYYNDDVGEEYDYTGYGDQYDDMGYSYSYSSMGDDYYQPSEEEDAYMYKEPEYEIDYSDIEGGDETGEDGENGDAGSSVAASHPGVYYEGELIEESPAYDDVNDFVYDFPLDEEITDDFEHDVSYPNGNAESMSHSDASLGAGAGLAESAPNSDADFDKDQDYLEDLDDELVKGIQDFTLDQDSNNMIELPEDLVDPSKPINLTFAGDIVSKQELEMVFGEILDRDINEGVSDFAIFDDPVTLPVANGFIDNVNDHTGEHFDTDSESPNSPDCSDFSDLSEANLCALERGRRNKNRPDSKKKFPKGWQSACGKRGANCKSQHAINNCDRGWDSDNKQCAHGCRAEFIANNGRSSYKSKLYGSKKYVRCEMCLVLSDMVKRHNFIQKSLGNLKGSSPSFCDYQNDQTCMAKEKRFAACSGVSICQRECWSENADNENCRNCQNKWCSKNKTWKTYFVVCSKKFDSCMEQYKPEDFKTAGEKIQLEGRLNCWGTYMEDKKVSYLDKPRTLPLHEQCQRALDPKKFPFKEWEMYHKFCHQKVCDLDIDNPDRDSVMCDDIWCLHAGLTNNGVSRPYINCNVCRHCRIMNMAVSGNYDRKLNDGRPNKIIDELKIQDSMSKYYRYEIQQMSEQAAALLPSNGCKSCDLDYERVTCRDMCNKFEKYILLQTQSTDPMYRWAQSVCRSNRCVLHLRKSCKDCTKMSEKNARKEWTTNLGTSEIRNNFKGYGCNLDCVPYKMATMSEYAGVNIMLTWTPAMQAAFDLMAVADSSEIEDEAVVDMIEWANSAEI